MSLLRRKQVDEFFDIGFTRIDGLFSSSEISEMLEAFERLERKAKRLERTGMYRGSQFVVERNGGRHFLNPAGERVLPAPTPPVLGDPVPSWRRDSIDAGTTMPDWDGEPPNYEEMLRPLFERDRGLVRRAG